MIIILLISAVYFIRSIIKRYSLRLIVSFVHGDPHHVIATQRGKEENLPNLLVSRL